MSDEKHLTVRNATTLRLSTWSALLMAVKMARKTGLPEIAFLSKAEELFALSDAELDAELQAIGWTAGDIEGNPGGVH